MWLYPVKTDIGCARDDTILNLYTNRRIAVREAARWESGTGSAARIGKPIYFNGPFIDASLQSQIDDYNAFMAGEKRFCLDENGNISAEDV